MGSDHAAGGDAAGIRTPGPVVARRWAFVWSLVVLGVAVEGALFPNAPWAVLHLAYLPALALGSPHMYPALLGLAFAEWALGLVPAGAAFSLAGTVVVIDQFIRDDINVGSGAWGAILLAIIDLLRQFWIAGFAALYGTPVPPTPWLHIAVEAVLGFAVMAALHGLLSRPRPGELVSRTP